jgi:cell filamentation protein
VANYTYPNTDTVKNKFGETDLDRLERLEASAVAARLVEIEAGYGPKGQFNVDHLKAIHRHLFQDVYEWAGQTRDQDVKLSDGTVATEPVMRKPGGLFFLGGHLIRHILDNVTEKVRAAGYLCGLPREEFATRAAGIMADLNAIHPFRDGNGRTQRAFVSALADQAGHSLDFTVVSRERMIQASIAANDRDDSTMMRRLFNEISDPSRVAALRQAIEFFEKRRFPWNDRYLVTIESGHQVELTMVGTAGDHFMGRTRSEILIGNTSDLPTRYPRSHETFTIVPRAAIEKADNPAPDPSGNRSDDPTKPSE